MKMRVLGLWLLGGLAVVFAVFMFFRSVDDEQRALLSLPAATRAAVYSGEWKNFQILCGADAASGLKDWCSGQSQFLVQFPECLEDCKGLTYRYLVSRPR